MKKVKATALIFMCAVMCTAVFMTGCMGTHNTIDEPEITVGYLSGEYAAQLVRDGANVIFGSIVITEGENGDVFVDVSEMEYVEAPDYPGGFYIADKNLVSEYMLPAEARATFLSGSTSIAQPMNADEFVEAVANDAESFGSGDPEYLKSKLYYIYAMGDQIELLIARYLP